jgi:hypothetical protein
VVDHAYGVGDLGAEHGPDLLVGVAAVGAGRDEHHHVVEGDDPLELLEHRRDHQVSGLRTGAVAHGDGDALPGPEQVTQGRPGDRSAQRPAEQLALVVGGRGVVRFHDRRPRLGEVDLQAVVTVGQPHSHRALGHRGSSASGR